MALSSILAPSPQVLRSKGFLWLAGRDEMSGEWSQAGAVIRIRCTACSQLPTALEIALQAGDHRDLLGGMLLYCFC